MSRSVYAYKRYVNIGPNHFAGYKADGPDGGDPLVLVFASTIEAHDPQDALGAVWIRHNRDDRPDGQIGPSLSVGDVVVLQADGQADAQAYSCGGFGWSEVAEPTNIDPRSWVEATRDAYR